jgi:hypothetical protein
MGRTELRAAAKAAGIKYGKLSLMQIREALVKEAPASKTSNNKKSTRNKRGGTKMEAAIAIMKDNPDKSRKEIIALFISKAKLTKAGSNTYYTLVQKALKK